MTKKSDAPAIRFKGFSDAWEQRKFEEIAVRSSVICSDDTLPRVEYEDIVSGTGRLNKDIYAKQSSKSGIVFHQGDVLYGKLRPYLQNWLLPTFDGLAVGDFWVLQPQNADSSFLYRLIQSRQFDEVANQSTGTKMPRADWKLVSKTVFSIPSNISEQAAIGTYFTALDSLITLHQRKCALLFSPFQAFISMMFITSTFSWEQRKLGDIADIVGGGTPSTGNQSYWDGDIDWYAPAEIADQIYANSSQKKITGLGYENSSAKMLPPGTVLFTSRAGIGKTAILTRKGCTNQGFQSIVPHRGELDSYFIFSRTEELKRYGELVGAGSTFVEVSGKQMAVMELMMPPTMREQQTIGGFFQQLDHLITLHQRKCIFFTGRAGRLISTVNKKRITSSWEQRKLGDIASDMVAGGDIDKDLILAEGQYPVIANALTGDGIVGYYDKEYRVNAPAVTVTGRGDVGHAKARLVNFTPVVRLLSVKSEHDVFFLENAINTLKIVIESTGVPQLTVPQLAKYEVAFPRQLDEEEHIGAFFKQLDHLITLHQRQHFLHSTPDISLSVRLIHPFYTSSWEQRKAKEICSIGTGKSNTQDQVDDGKYPFYIRSDVPVRSNKYLYDCEAVITIGDGNIGKVFHYVNGKFDLHQRCYKMTDFKDIWGKYFFYYFSTKFYDRAMKMTAKATVDSVRLEMISEMDIKKPPQISEQKQIAEFFANLDNLITLHQRKGKAAVSGCSNDANNSKGVCCKARDFGYKCHKKDEPNRFDA